MRKRRVIVVLLVLLAGGTLLLPSYAQVISSDVVFSRTRSFRIPFNIGPGADQLKQLQLFVSTDRGKSWQPSAVAPPNAAPDQRYFRFVSEDDGLYWFTVQTLDKKGQRFPANMENAKPSLKVLVDTLPPEAKIFPLAPENGKVGVTWQVREEHIDLLDAQSIRLEYRQSGTKTWIPLNINRVVNQYYWNPQTNAILDVRLTAVDRAGNLDSATTQVSLRSNGLPPSAPIHPNNTAGNNGHQLKNVPAARRLVNSKKISLSYDIADKGPSGVSAIELWFTQDGQNWNKYPLPKSQFNVLPNPLVFEVNGEGIYGFTLVARNGVGLGARPPQIGDDPQIWVEVDLTRPKVKLGQVIVHKGQDKGKLTISWSAFDKNLSNTPISLTYSETLTGPWEPITREPLKNEGSYDWQMPQPMNPYQFYVRIEAVDMAGNIGEDITQDLVKVDLSQPKVNILKVESAGGGE